MDVATLLTKVSDNLSVRRAFGTAYEKDGLLIIPVAMVAGGGGGGTGTHPRPRDPAGSGPQPEGSGMAEHNGGPRDAEHTDAGGGFGGVVLPTGAYVVKDGQVRWVPAVDTTIVVLASLGLARLLVRAWARSRSR